MHNDIADWINKYKNIDIHWFLSNSDRFNYIDVITQRSLKKFIITGLCDGNHRGCMCL